MCHSDKMEQVKFSSAKTNPWKILTMYGREREHQANLWKKTRKLVPCFSFWIFPFSLLMLQLHPLKAAYYIRLILKLITQMLIKRRAILYQESFESSFLGLLFCWGGCSHIFCGFLTDKEYAFYLILPLFNL